MTCVKFWFSLGPKSHSGTLIILFVYLCTISGQSFGYLCHIYVQEGGTSVLGQAALGTEKKGGGGRGVSSDAIWKVKNTDCVFTHLLHLLYTGQ